MPFTDGTFLNVSGATSAASGQTIQSTVWNNIHSDYSSALNILADQLAGSTTYKNIAWMNGGMEVWQRGTSIELPSAGSNYTLDRWYALTNANQATTVSRQTGLTNNSQYCARVQRDSGQTGVDFMGLGYPLDTDEIYRVRGKFAYVRFSIRAGANWSPASGNITVYVNCGTGASPAKATSGSFTGLTQLISQTVAITTTTQLVQVISSSVIPLTTTQMEVGFNWTPVGTAGAADYFEVDDVELVAVPVDDADNYIPDGYEYLPFDVALEGCKTHYAKTFQYSTTVGYAKGNGQNGLFIVGNATDAQGIFWLYGGKSVRATAPSVTLYSLIAASASSWTGFNGSASVAATIFTAGERGILITGTPATANVGFGVHAAVSAGI